MSGRVRTLCLLLALALLLPCAAVRADDGRGQNGFSFEADFSRESLGEAIERYLDVKRPAGSIAIGWLDLTSGEEWYHNPDLFLEGASTYKLPLAMLYADRIAAGELTEESVIGHYRLYDALETMLVDSNNAAGSVLRSYAVPRGELFKRLIVPYGGLDESELPEAFFVNNSYSPRFLIGTLRTLYENEEKYALILGFLKRARPNDYFCRYRGELEVAHKYGSDFGFVCDSAIIYAERPFALCVMTFGVDRAPVVLGEIARIAMDYAAYLAAQPEPTPEPAAAPTPGPTPEPAAAPTPASTPLPTDGDAPAAGRKGRLTPLPIALAGCAVLLALPLRLRRRKNDKKDS